MTGVDRAIRVSTAVAVLAVAGVAAYVSYWHAYAVVCAHGETGITARLEPATIDGLVYASSMVNLYAARHRLPVPSLARWLLALGIIATLAANMAQGWSHGPVGAVIAAWPAVSLVGSAMSCWSGSSVPQQQADWTAGQQRTTPAGTRTIRPTGARVPACPKPRRTTGWHGSASCLLAGMVRRSRPADQQRTRGADQARARRRTMRTRTRTRSGPVPGKPVPPAMRARPSLRRWPRTGPASRRAGRCRSASWRACSARPRAAGRAAAWPKHGRARVRYRPRNPPRRSGAARAVTLATRSAPISALAFTVAVGRSPFVMARRLTPCDSVMLLGEISAGAVTGWCYGVVSITRS